MVASIKSFALLQKGILEKLGPSIFVTVGLDLMEALPEYTHCIVGGLAKF